MSSTGTDSVRFLQQRHPNRWRPPGRTVGHSRSLDLSLRNPQTITGQTLEEFPFSLLSDSTGIADLLSVGLDHACAISLGNDAGSSHSPRES